MAGTASLDAASLLIGNIATPTPFTVPKRIARQPAAAEETRARELTRGVRNRLRNRKRCVYSIPLYKKGSAGG